MNISYTSSKHLTPAEFVSVLERSGLAERRPVADPARIEQMLEHADLLVSAWDGGLLVGVARSVTDFAYCCYLSDLAVDRNYQGQGIGRRLVEETQHALHPGATVILLAAPAARGYYPKIGMEPHPSAWLVSASAKLRTTPGRAS